MDRQRAQILREKCNRALSGKSLHDVVGALEMLTADIVVGSPLGSSEAGALSAFDAIAADIRNIIRERFATQTKGH